MVGHAQYIYVPSVDLAREKIMVGNELYGSLCISLKFESLNDNYIEVVQIYMEPGS